jgi:hypothetical protein
MTLDEAIETLETVLGCTETDEPEGCIEALKLGIEALKMIQGFRTSVYKINSSLLPGETEK